MRSKCPKHHEPLVMNLAGVVFCRSCHAAGQAEIERLIAPQRNRVNQFYRRWVHLTVKSGVRV